MAFDHTRARRLYGQLLRLYPRAFRTRFAQSIEQTFADAWIERRGSPASTLGFTATAFAGTAAGILREHLSESTMKNPAAHPYLAALAGLAFIAPAFIANAIVANRIEPFFSMIRPGPHTSTGEYVLLAIVLLLLPIGAFVALRPTIAKGEDGRRRLLPLNILIALAMVSLFVLISKEMGTEVYRCDVLKVANCD